MSEVDQDIVLREICRQSGTNPAEWTLIAPNAFTWRAEYSESDEQWYVYDLEDAVIDVFCDEESADRFIDEAQEKAEGELFQFIHVGDGRLATVETVDGSDEIKISVNQRSLRFLFELSPEYSPLDGNGKPQDVFEAIRSAIDFFEIPGLLQELSMEDRQGELSDDRALSGLAQSYDERSSNPAGIYHEPLLVRLPSVDAGHEEYIYAPPGKFGNLPLTEREKAIHDEIDELLRRVASETSDKYDMTDLIRVLESVGYFYPKVVRGPVWDQSFPEYQVSPAL